MKSEVHIIWNDHHQTHRAMYITSSLYLPHVMVVTNHCVGDHSNIYIHTNIHTSIHTCYFIGSHRIYLFSIIKVKVKVSLSTPWRCIMGVGAQRHIFLTSEQEGGERSTSCCSCFMPGKEPQYLLNWRPGGPWSWSGQFGEEENPLLCQELNHRLCSLYPSHRRGSAIQLHGHKYLVQ